MNSTDKILALVGSLLVLLVSQKSEVRFKPCMNNDPYAKNLTVTVGPNPIIVKDGAKVDVYYHANLLKTIRPRSKIKLTLQIYELFAWITIPCIKVIAVTAVKGVIEKPTLLPYRLAKTLSAPALTTSNSFWTR